MNLTPFEIDVLRALAGEDVPDMTWGAAVSVAMEELASQGLIVGESDGTVTNKGRDYLAIKRNAINIRADEMVRAAAPDMLLALQEICDASENGVEQDAFCRIIFNKAARAIAKAKRGL